MMQQEQQIQRLVKQTLHQVGHIENGRLKQLMPAIPKQKRPFWYGAMPRQLATVALMLLLLLGGWQWLNNNQPALLPSPPTIVAVTATMTYTPAATETQAMPTETAVADKAEPNAILTPAPPPTPVAAVPINTN